MTTEQTNTETVSVVKVARASVENVEERIETWLRANASSYESASVKSLTVPSAGGLSGETLIVHLNEQADKTDGWHTLVVRKEVLDMVTNPLINFANLLRVQSVLGDRSEYLVPKILGIEHNAEVLGAPFFVMTFCAGSIPSDVPPYTTAGFVFDATAEQRESMWASGMDALVRVHNFDWQAHRLGSLQLDIDGKHDIERHINYAIKLYQQEVGSYTSPVCDRAIAWLREHSFVAERQTLCWGDARIGNIIWKDYQCAAVIDWDMACLGTAGIDLGWWSFFHRWSTYGMGIPTLSGMCVGQDLADLYQARGGHAIENMAFYEILATLRGISVWLSTFASMKAQGVAPDISPIDDSMHIIKVLELLLHQVNA